MSLIAIFLLVIFFYSLFSCRLEKTVITAPIVFTAAGMLLAGLLPELSGRDSLLRPFLSIAETGLVLLLFTDASRTDLQILRSISNLPTRLLSVGMLLTLLLGALAAWLVFPQLSLAEAGILAAILAPTDAGLGQIIVSSPRVPMRIRQALNVEAGLNDGLSVPFLLFFLAITGPATGEQERLIHFIVEQLGYGALVGVGIGLVGGWLLSLARRREWMAESFLQVGVVALPLACIVVSEAFGASMFIAAFVAGLAVQIPFREAGRHSGEFGEQWGQLFNFAVFFLFGMLVAKVWPQFNWRHLLYAALSLTVVRLIPVAIALIGTHLGRATVVFMGWFGPRGLASIVLGLVYLEHSMHSGPSETIIRLAVMATVWLSILAHGLSAMPGIGLYVRNAGSMDAGVPEHQGAKAIHGDRNHRGG